MKKQLIRTTLIMLIMMLIIINLSGISHAASSLEARLSSTTTEIEKGTEISVTVSLANINVGDGVNTLKGTIGWDTEVLEFVDYERTVNDWSTTWNSSDGTLVAVHLSGLVKADTAIAKLIFRVKDTVDVEETTINLSNIESANTQEKVNPDNTSLTLKIKEEAVENPDGGNQDNTPNDGNQSDNSDNGNQDNNNQNNGNGAAGNNNNEGNSTGGNGASGSGTTTNNKPTTTVTNNGSSTSKIPYTGVSDTIIIAIIGLAVIGIISYTKYRKYRGI